MKINLIKNYIFTEEETRVIRHVLDYAWHRLGKHPEAGIHNCPGVSLENVNELRIQLQKPTRK